VGGSNFFLNEKVGGLEPFPLLGIGGGGRDRQVEEVGITKEGNGKFSSPPEGGTFNGHFEGKKCGGKVRGMVMMREGQSEKASTVSVKKGEESKGGEKSQGVHPHSVFQKKMGAKRAPEKRKRGIGRTPLDPGKLLSGGRFNLRKASKVGGWC